MKIFSCLFFLILISSSSFALDVQNKITETVDPQLRSIIFNSTVSIRTFHFNEDQEVESYQSGLGTLIHPKWVLTVAHLFDQFEPGSVFIQGEKKQIKKIYLFPNALSEKGHSDLALLELLESETSSSVAKLSLRGRNPGPFFVSGYDRDEYSNRNFEDSIEKDVNKKIGIVFQLFGQIGSKHFSSHPECNGLQMSTMGLETISDTRFSNCSLEEGDSGGGLFDSKGQIVGVSARTTVLDLYFPAHPEENDVSLNMSMWIPIDTAKKTWIEHTIGNPI